jgi:hypothetical protein
MKWSKLSETYCHIPNHERNTVVTEKAKQQVPSMGAGSLDFRRSLGCEVLDSIFCYVLLGNSLSLSSLIFK